MCNALMGGQVKHNLNLRMFTSVVEKIMLEGNGAGGAGKTMASESFSPIYIPPLTDGI